MSDTTTSDHTVIIYELPTIDDLKCLHIRDWAIPQLAPIDRQLRATKSLIDKPYQINANRWERITRRLEVSYHISQRIRPIIPLANNTVSKLIELLNQFSHDIFPTGRASHEFVHFDNAAMPGIFPYTMKYYLHANHPNLKYVWYASSLIETTKEAMSPLRDEYGLWKNYPDNWLMDDNYNGDVMSQKVQQHFKERLGGKVDLYTSDIGFDVSFNYNEQETLQSPTNLGQVISGLITLKKGGTLITKQYTFMTSFTISLMGLLTRLFNKLYVTKPMTSKPDNSETYLVGIGYNGIDDDMMQMLMRRLDNVAKIGVVHDVGKTSERKVVPMKPLIQKGCIGADFINAIITATEHISGNTIAKIESNLAEFAESNVKKSSSTGSTSKMSSEVDKWFMVNPIKPIPNDKFLRTSQKPRQKQTNKTDRRKFKK